MDEIFPAPGDLVFIRAVTNYYTGRVERVFGGFVHLADAAWIPSTGRFADAMASGKFDEVEPYPNGCAVAIGAIVDIAPFGHALPRVQK